LVCVFNAWLTFPYTSVQALGRPAWKAIEDLATIPVTLLLAWWLMRRAMASMGAAFAKLLLTHDRLFYLVHLCFSAQVLSFRDVISGPLFRGDLASAGLLTAVYFMPISHVKLPSPQGDRLLFSDLRIAVLGSRVDEED